VTLVARDWYVESIEEIERTAAALHDAVDSTVIMLRRARAERLHGAGVTQVVERLMADGLPETRRQADEAFAAYTAAITRYRARAIRALVDDEGMTLSEVARLTGVSPQAVGRLYRSIGGDGSVTPRG
jgi:hypothetical protein